MAIFMRSLCLGYGTAIVSGWWLMSGGEGWFLPLLAVWLGGAVLTLGFAAVGAWLWPGDAAAGSAESRDEGRDTLTEAEIRAWEADAMSDGPAHFPRPGLAVQTVAANDLAPHGDLASHPA